MPDKKDMGHDLKVMSRELEEKGAEFTAIELRLPEELSMDEWCKLGRRLCRADQVAKWWLGDWAAFGMGDPEKDGWRRHGKLKDFAEANGFDYGYLRNLAWVSRSVQLSRRRDNVEWTKHQEVASLPPQDQEKWLAKIEKEDLPRAELRRQIRQAGGEFNALESDGPVLKFASKACDDLVNWLRTQPEGWWDEGRRAAWRKRLEPIVRFWEKL